MKVDKHETHDRYLSLMKTSDQIEQGVRDCIKNRPDEFGTYPFYIFAHKRTIGIDERIVAYNDDFAKHIQYGTPRMYNRIDDVPTHRLIWQPRLSKPKAEANSMCFRYEPKMDVIEVIWILPDEHLFESYKKGLLTESEIITHSIHLYTTDKKALERSLPGDVDEETGNRIYLEIASNVLYKEKKTPILLPKV